METELLRRAADIVDACCRDESPKFLGFLSESQSAQLSTHLKNKAAFCFSGGYEGAERTFLCVMPTWLEKKNISFPFSGITFNFSPADKLYHKDFLGVLMALNIKRETVGDILIETGRAVVFLKNDIVKFVVSEVKKIGSVGVSVEEGFLQPLPSMSDKKQVSSTVASARIDSVVAALAGISRAKSVEMIAKKMVSVNSLCCDKTTLQIKNGDKLSVKSCGKFNVLTVDGVTKKGRIIIKAEKYI